MVLDQLAHDLIRLQLESLRESYALSKVGLNGGLSILIGSQSEAPGEDYLAQRQSF